jgi:hypothetical protein
MSKPSVDVHSQTSHMIIRSKNLLLLSIFVSTCVAAQNLPVAQPTLTLSNGDKVEFFIEGRSVTAFVAPGMPSKLTLSNATAQTLYGKEANKFASGFERAIAELARSEFDNTPPRHIQTTVGPVKIKGQQRLAEIEAGGRVETQLVQWYQRDMYSFGDALAGPYAIPVPVIRFVLRPAQAGETTFTVPLALDAKRWLASSPKLIGKKKVYFAFAPQFERTLASAGAGAAIAQIHGGEFTGDPVPVQVTYNVSRPARPVQLKTPIMLGSISLSKLLVRSRDYGNTNAIKEAKSADAGEEDEILVRAKRKGTNPEYFVYIGNDILKNCSSITYDKPGETATLSCVLAK